MNAKGNVKLEYLGDFSVPWGVRFENGELRSIAEVRIFSKDSDRPAVCLSEWISHENVEEVPKILARPKKKFANNAGKAYVLVESSGRSILCIPEKDAEMEDMDSRSYSYDWKGIAVSRHRCYRIGFISAVMGDEGVRLDEKRRSLEKALSEAAEDLRRWRTEDGGQEFERLMKRADMLRRELMAEEERFRNPDKASGRIIEVKKPFIGAEYVSAGSLFDIMEREFEAAAKRIIRMNEACFSPDSCYRNDFEAMKTRLEKELEYFTRFRVFFQTISDEEYRRPLSVLMSIAYGHDSKETEFAERCEEVLDTYQKMKQTETAEECRKAFESHRESHRESHQAEKRLRQMLWHS